MTAGGEDLVRVERLCKRFGGVVAASELSFAIPRGRITALIGPNGAGKTTVFNCLSGLYQPSGGEVWWLGSSARPRRLSGRKPHQVTRLGLARTFQNIRLFASMTALENVMVGQHVRSQAGILGAIFRPASVRQEEERIVRRAFACLSRVGLAHRAQELARTLPYGDQRRLEIARALATEPLLLLLDEPAAGLNPSETREMEALIRRLAGESGLTVLLIEHDMRLVMAISDTVLVMDRGQIIAAGPPREVAADPRVIAAYLGAAA
ncbi:MAG: ABC transporter ATP-binding protein [Thermodesulfobacteriota bacterium]